MQGDGLILLPFFFFRMGMEDLIPNVDPKPAPIIPPSDWEYEDDEFEEILSGLGL